VLVQGLFETFVRFAFHDDAAGEQGMAERVLRRDLLPDSVTGPWERAPLARADSMFRCEDMIPDSRIERGGAEAIWKFFCFHLLT
jgi:hypothetical protein